ncbi:ectoine/hydroxyectoine ABC transporter permease subunit EhuC, partial [Klebsiella pneumoniae]|nr:ectoine/hydroxyectoine ABC transporter permease subunit EhuC [Klebsiella pneumoniae]
MPLISEHIAELAPPLLEGLAVTLEIMAGAVV